MTNMSPNKKIKTHLLPKTLSVVTSLKFKHKSGQTFMNHHLLNYIKCNTSEDDEIFALEKA